MVEPSAASPRSSSRWAWLGSAAILLVLTGWVFQDVLFRGRLLSYRDSLQFYYPLFEYVQQEWEAGRVPLWNPYDNGGQPLLAAGTSSVLYPVKAMFFLPVSYWARYHLYVLFHVVMAGATCGWVARRWGASWPAAALAALSYALCGNVLFQYCNVVFLCGAAWLPLTLWSGDRLLQRRSLAGVPPFAATLAMMALAGDAQLAYVAGMLAALQGALLWWSDRQRTPVAAAPAAEPAPNSSRRRRPAPLAPPPPSPPVAESRSRWASLGVHRLVLLGAAATLALLLSAVQILPTLEFSKSSVRAAREVPLSLYEIPRFLLRQGEFYPRADTRQPPQWYEGLVGNPPPPAKHEVNIYGFSLEPWRLVEFLWPNIAGRRFPENHRWAELLGWQGQAWVDSNYMGLFPFLLALAAWRVRRTDARTRWLSWTALLSVLAGFGIYAPGKLLVNPPATGDLFRDLGHPLLGGVGGLYWLLTVLLPGFAEFRYPSKLLVPAACALSLLAAAGFDRYLTTPDRRWTRWLAAIAGASAAAAVGLLPFRERLEAYFTAHQKGVNDAFRAAGAFVDVEVALWHTAAVAVVLACLTWLLRRQANQPAARQTTHSSRFAAALTPHRLAWTLVVVAGVDLAIANSPLVDTIDRAAWERTPDLVEYLREASAARDPDAVRPPRVHRPDGWSHPLRDSLSDVQIDVYVRWQRDTLFGMQNLPYRIPRLFSVGSIESNEQEAWFDFLPLPKSEAFDFQAIVQPRRAYDAWGCRFFVLPKADQPQDPERSKVGFTTEWTEPQERLNRNLPGDPTTRGQTGFDELVLRHVPLGDSLEPALPGRPNPIPALAGEVLALDNDSAFPPAWIVHRILPTEPIPSWNRKRWLPLMISMVFPQDRPFDLRTEAYVEDQDLAAALGTWPVEWTPSAAATETCRITRYEPLEVDIEATLSAIGVVVLSDTYTDDWTALVSSNGGPFEPQPVYRTNRTMRGLMLGPGRHTIRYRYVPQSFYVGAVLSLLSVGALLVWSAVRWLRRRRADLL